MYLYCLALSNAYMLHTCIISTAGLSYKLDSSKAGKGASGPSRKPSLKGVFSEVVETSSVAPQSPSLAKRVKTEPGNIIIQHHDIINNIDIW